MADTSIQWCDKVWNPVTGCTKVSQGCKNCYAETVANRFWKGRKFTDVRCHEDRLDQPLRWRKPSRVFVNSMSDLFQEGVPFNFIDNVFAVMAAANPHTYQILTKRPERMLEYMTELSNAKRAVCSKAAEYRKSVIGGLVALGWAQGRPVPNVWLGVSVENQETGDERIPILLQTPAAVRFLSVEPLLDNVDLAEALTGGVPTESQAYGPNGLHFIRHGAPRVDWVIVGAESGPRARPMNEDWVRAIRDQCVEAGVAFFYKQNAINGKKIGTPELDGRRWMEFPGVTRLPSGK